MILRRELSSLILVVVVLALACAPSRGQSNMTGAFYNKPVELKLERSIKRRFRSYYRQRPGEQFLPDSYDRWKVRIYGETAVVHCVLDIHALVDGHEWGAEVLVTDVWVKERDAWRVVARHTSPILRAKDGMAENRERQDYLEHPLG